MYASIFNLNLDAGWSPALCQVLTGWRLDGSQNWSEHGGQEKTPVFKPTIVFLINYTQD
jgi:hypothetical protein